MDWYDPTCYAIEILDAKYEKVSTDDIGPLINLGTQHDGRSARTWMKRVLTTFVLLWEGEKDLLESTKMDFYET